MKLVDFFNRVTIKEPSDTISCDRCIFTVVSPGYEELLDDMFSSLNYFYGSHDAILVVFVVNPNDSILQVINKYNAYPILCYEKSTNIDTKAVIYNIVDFVDSKKYIYLDTDVMVLKSLNPLFDLLDEVPEDCVCMALDQYFGWATTFEEAYTGTLYNGSSGDFEYLLNKDCNAEKNYKSIVNAGIFACKKTGLVKMRDTICKFNNISHWAKEGFIREQFVVNLSLSLNNNLIMLDPKYNWQINQKTAFRYEHKSDTVSVYVGFNPFFLDHVRYPMDILFRLVDHNDLMSRHIKSKLDNRYNAVLDNFGKVSCSRLEFISIIEDLLNSLIIQLDLFDNEFIKSFGDLYSDIEIDEVPQNYSRVRINKEIISRYYINEFDRRKDNYIEQPISILHFNGPNKNFNNVRSYIKNCMLVDKPRPKQEHKNYGVKIGISTHRMYQDITLPRLLDSLVNINGISPSDIVVVSGGWDKESNCFENGITYYRVTHNSFDHNSIVHVVEKDLESKYWFFMQDTCNAGPYFYERLLSYPVGDLEYMTVDGQGYLNMGLFSWEYLQNNKAYILKLKNCTKERAMLSEKIFMGLGKTGGFGDMYPTFVGYSDIYHTGTLRNICHYPAIDLYKYQANMLDNLRIVKP